MGVAVKALFAGVVAGGLACGGVLADDVKALRKTADENKTTFGVWNQGYGGYYVDGESEATHRNRQTAYLGALKALTVATPEDPAVHLEYAAALLFKKDAAAAEPEYRRAKELYLSQKRLVQNGLAGAMYGIANCRFAAGDRDAAIAELKDLVSRNLSGGGRYEVDWSGLARTALAFLEDRVLTSLGLPRYTGAKVFPDAHQAEYSETFTPIGKVTVKGLDSDDLRYELLKRKLGARGIAVERPGLVSTLPGASDFLLEIVGDASEAELEGARATGEAYRLEVGAKRAKITACTKRGVTWGVVSFIQLLDGKKPAVRQAKILDWSDAGERSASGMFATSEIEFALFYRLTAFVAQQHPTYDNLGLPLNEYVEDEQGRLFSGFGLKYYYGIAWATMYPQLPLSSERTLRHHVEICKRHARSGAGVYFPFDDGRFSGGVTASTPRGTKSGLHPLDDKAYGCAANVDGAYLSKLYRAVKAEFPGFYMVFCPPFYWGPDSASSYPEDRENYLKELGETLDPEIDLFWTGPMVKSYDIRKYQVDWFAKLTKRKPFYWQNALGPHNLLDYLVDDIPLDAFYYDGMDRDIAGVFVNGHSYQRILQSLPVAYFWNHRGYDKDAMAKRTVQQIFGEKSYDILKPGRDALAYFDKYKYGALNAGIAYEKPEDLKEKWLLASNCWAQAQAYCPLVKAFGRYEAAVGYAERVYRGSLNPPDFVKKHKADIEECEAFAKAEAGYDKAKGDIFISPIGLAGPKYGPYAHPKKVKNAATGRYDIAPGGGKLPKRFCSFVRGAQSATPSVRFRFECDPFPPSGDYTFVLSGLGDETEAANKVRVTINGKTIADDLDLGFDNLDFKVREITVPFASMVRNNVVEIMQVTPGSNLNGTPWIALNYVIVRKSGRK